MRVLVLTLALTTGALAQSNPTAMTDEKLFEAFKVCVVAQTDGGGTLAGNPEMAELCDPIIKERDRRSTNAVAAKQRQQMDDLKKLLK